MSSIGPASRPGSPGFDPALSPSTPPAAPAAPGAPVSRTPSSSGRPVIGASTGATTAAAAVSSPTGRIPAGKHRVTFVYDAGAHKGLTNLQLKGSFNPATGAFDPQWNGGAPIAMRPLGGGKWAATVDLLDDGPQKHDWRWGVTADGPSGKGQWAVMGEEPLKLELGAAAKQEVSYSPTTYHVMGAQKQPNGDVGFRFWAPNARGVSVKITDENGRTERVPMTKDAGGNWEARVAGGFRPNLGKAYVYEVTTSDGKTVERADPYARVMQGEQRGIGRFYIDPTSGKEANKFTPGAVELMRFEIGNEPGYAGATMVLKDASGKRLTKAELLQRLGPFDSKLIDKARGGKFNDLWTNRVKDDGTIDLVNAGGSTWTALVNNPEKLNGLRYELQVWEKGPNGELRLHDDKNRDNVFTDAERRASPNNDRWSDVISPASGRSFRGSVIADTSFRWTGDAAPRETDPKKWSIYQVHVGSFFGMDMNARRSTIDDLVKRLDYFKSLGVNTLELLPTNEVEGERDWGYMGVNNLAVESAFGFEENHRWVTGTEALKRLIDEAHKKGLNVVNDVVYNHVGGDNNFMWDLDGPENPYFNWSTDPKKLEKRDTQWGAVPAYNKPQVRQFFVDHAVSQLDEFHFDGLRFDFTEPIKGTGGKDGWEMLREMNRQLHFLKPNTFIAAEQFDYDPAITKPAETGGKGGAGFDAQWYTEFQHRLVHDNSNPSIIQEAVSGRRTNMDQFMGMLTSPRGLTSWGNAVTVISNHDEVGNAQRTIDVADGDSTATIPPQFARNMARFTAGVGLTAPGVPIMFMGEESMAQNEFKWGVPATWDLGWEWETLGKSWSWDKITFNDDQQKLYERLCGLPRAQREQDGDFQKLPPWDRQVVQDLAALPGDDRVRAMRDIHRRQSFTFFQDSFAVRKSSPAFAADAAVERVYTHNDNSVMAFARKAGGDEFLVVGSLNRQNYSNYRLDLPPGRWKEVLNSDGAKYGGGNFGNLGGTINGGAGASLNIPAGGVVILKKV